MAKAKPSIMLVMKDAHLRSILFERFEREGWRCEGADEISLGERKAVKFRPQVFFVELGDAPGEVKRLLKHWRSLPTLHKSRIVLMFSNVSREHVDEAMQSGADHVILSGTLSPKEIVQSVSNISL